MLFQESANSFSYKCTLWSIFGPCLCIKSCKPTFTRICREFENWRYLRALSGKFLWQKYCCPESFRFFWLCDSAEGNFPVGHQCNFLLFEARSKRVLVCEIIPFLDTNKTDLALKCNGFVTWEIRKLIKINNRVQLLRWIIVCWIDNNNETASW